MLCIIGLACPDISYNVQPIMNDTWSECSETQEQVVLLFLFIKYWDNFHLELLDIIGGQQFVVEHLGQILNCNKDVLSECIRPVLHRILDEYIQLRKNRRRVQTATHIICDAIQSVISCSTNHDFRTKSLELLKVSHTQELKISLQRSLENVILNRFLPSRVCNIKQVSSGGGGYTERSNDPVTPETGQENPCEIDNLQRIYSELEDSSPVSVDGDIPCHSDQSLTPELTSTFEQRTGSRKRQLEMNKTNPLTMKNCVDQCGRPSKQTMSGAGHQPRTDYVSTHHISLEKATTQILVPGPPRSTSDGKGSELNSQEQNLKNITGDQEDYLWLQEVHNLSEWTQ
ncbi:type 2 DNA topoisomerase 6 subunit B-like [Narcine bancroftii]|uniref:type 2 DNA topoisomerase 6 subunit B-like n=1 Tax=Narcine bancroftii TaxID=1343680 RepID=UPI0038311330